MLVTAIVATVALSTYDASVTGLAPVAGAEARQQFADVLYAVGTPSFPALARAIQPDLVIGYIDAYVAGVRTALFLGGAAAVLGGSWPGSGSAGGIRWRRAAPTRWPRSTSTATSA